MEEGQVLASDVVLDAVNGNQEAMRFLTMIGAVLHLWDDLIDADKVLTAEDVNTGFWHALIDLPRNPFYRTHFEPLNTILAAAIINWRAATWMERLDKPQDDHELMIAFVIRSTYIDLATMCALIIGGAEWAAEKATGLRAMIHNEGFEQYLINLKTEQATREG